METIKKRLITLITIGVLLSLSINFLEYDTFYRSSEAIATIRDVPMSFEQWRGKKLHLDPIVYEILETRSVIHRDYFSNQGEYINLSVVYYPETKVDFHTPEACLGGEGIEIKKNNRQISIQYQSEENPITLSELIWQREGQEFLVYYFYKAGQFFGDNYIKLRFHLIWNRFLERKKSGSLIRVSTNIRQGDIDQARTKLKHFIQDIFPYFMEYL